MTLQEHYDKMAELNKEERQKLIEHGKNSVEMISFYLRKNDESYEFVKDIMTGQFENAPDIKYISGNSFYYDKVEVTIPGDSYPYVILPILVNDIEKQKPLDQRFLFDFMAEYISGPDWEKRPWDDENIETAKDMLQNV